MTIQELKDKNLIIYESYRGSYVYGTYIEGVSDKDMFGVYVQSLEDIMSSSRYIPQVNDEKGDCVYYEVRRFLELLKVNNPNILEALATPKEFIIYKHPVFDLILQQKDKFITKICKDSFGGYARQQIVKAKSQDKMMNWERQKVTRKTPLDFCYIIDGNGTKKLKTWLNKKKIEQKFCGVVKIPNARDMYALYYDIIAHQCFSKYVLKKEREMHKNALKEAGSKVGLGYKGIVTEDENGNIVSNELKLSSIPKKENGCIQAYFSYNKDGYINHCKDYNKYQKWLNERNEARWVDVKDHGQKIDGKNMMHCIRLIDMAQEIAAGQGIIVRRPNAKYLLSIRKGEVNLETLITIAELKIAQMDATFNNSNLPEKIDDTLIDDLLIKIRKEIYGKRD